MSASSLLPGSGNNALIFQIPPVQGIPPQGQLVTLVVTNATSPAPPFTFTLFPFTHNSNRRVVRKHDWGPRCRLNSCGRQQLYIYVYGQRQHFAHGPIYSGRKPGRLIVGRRLDGGHRGRGSATPLLTSLFSRERARIPRLA